MKKSIEINFNNQVFQVSVIRGHVWLELGGGVSTPLAMVNCQHGGQYAYLVSSVGDATHEVRIYDDGEVYGALDSPPLIVNI